MPMLEQQDIVRLVLLIRGCCEWRLDVASFYAFVPSVVVWNKYHLAGLAMEWNETPVFNLYIHSQPVKDPLLCLEW